MAAKNSALSTGYLLLYNGILTFGWAYVLFLTLQNYSNLNELWTQVEIPLKIFQTAAFLEIVHVIIGVVPSNLFLTTFQVFSRLFAVWGVLHLSPPSQVSIGLPLLLFAWSVTEISRYGYYVFHLLGISSLLQWLRYTLFIFLYPIGVTGELISIYVALPYVQSHQLLTIRMPNSFNVAFDYQYFLYAVMLSYIPIFPHLYLHMFAQRRKILGGKPSDASAKKRT